LGNKELVSFILEVIRLFLIVSCNWGSHDVYKRIEKREGCEEKTLLKSKVQKKKGVDLKNWRQKEDNHLIYI
jgi:hypothetical protein